MTYTDQDLLAMAFNMLRECDKHGFTRLLWLRANKTMDTFRERIEGNKYFAPDSAIYGEGEQ